MLHEISKYLACSNSIEEALDNVSELCKKNSAAFKTLNVFVDRGFPTYCYTSTNKKVLRNIQIPWDSIVGESIRERKQVISCSSESLGTRWDDQSVDILHIMAKPLVCFNNAFGCMEFITEQALHQHEIEMFGIIGDYFGPIIYLQEWYSVERRIAHAIKNKAFIGILTLYDEDVDAEEKQSTLDQSFSEICSLSEDTLKLMGMKSEMNKINVNSIISSVVEKINKLARLNNRHIKVVEELSPGLEVYCDEFSIREEVIFNIVKNIWEEWQNKDMDERTVEFKTYKEENFATIEIKDYAGGMPEKIASRMGLPFESSKGYGRGVGMNIAYQVMKQHNGEISFKTKEGVGTTFFVKLSLLETNRRVVSRYQAQNIAGSDSGLVSLEFDSGKCTGHVVDLSLGGLSGIFKITPPYPKITGHAVVAVDFGNNNKVSGLTGSIARIEVAERPRDDGFIKVAVRFNDTADLLKKERLMHILSCLPLLQDSLPQS